MLTEKATPQVATTKSTPSVSVKNSIQHEKVADTNKVKKITVTLSADYKGVTNRKITFVEPTLKQLAQANENINDDKGFPNQIKLIMNIMKLVGNVDEEVIDNLPTSELTHINNQAEDFFT